MFRERCKTLYELAEIILRRTGILKSCSNSERDGRVTDSLFAGRALYKALCHKFVCSNIFLYLIQKTRDHQNMYFLSCSISERDARVTRLFSAPLHSFTRPRLTLPRSGKITSKMQAAASSSLIPEGLDNVYVEIIIQIWIRLNRSKNIKG